MNAALADEERGAAPVRLPWWNPERELRPATDRPYVDVLGGSTGLERGLLETEEFVKLACAALGATLDALGGPHKDRKTMRLRELVATVGIERWDQRAGKIGGVLGKHSDVVSRWARTGAARRSTDPEFAGAIDELDSVLVEAARHDGDS